MTRRNQNLGKGFGDRPRRSTCNTHLRSQDAANAQRIYFDSADKCRESSDNPTQGLGMPQAPVMPMIKSLFAAAVMLGTTSLGAFAQTTVLTVGGPTGQYATVRVVAADADTNLVDYVISVAPGTYTNDLPQVTRPMTIEAAVPGSAVISNAPAPLANEKGIILTSRI